MQVIWFAVKGLGMQVFDLDLIRRCHNLQDHSPVIMIFNTFQPFLDWMKGR